MKSRYTAGSQLQLQDNTVVTISSIKEEITFIKEENGQQVSQTLSGEDFQKLLKPSETDPKVGLKFIDVDKADCEVLEVTEVAISYKKSWGSQSWNSSMILDDYYAKLDSKMIQLQQ